MNANIGGHVEDWNEVEDSRGGEEELNKVNTE
jgi:hypothetical protein